MLCDTGREYWRGWTQWVPGMGWKVLVGFNPRSGTWSSATWLLFLAGWLGLPRSMVVSGKRISQRVKGGSCRLLRFRLGSHMTSFLPCSLGPESSQGPPSSREGEKGSSLTGDSRVMLQRGLWGWQYHLFPSWGTKLPHNLSLTSLLAHITLQIASFNNFYMGKELKFMGFLPHVECRAKHFHIGFLTDCDLYFQNDFPWT